MADRSDLHTFLVGVLGSTNVYFQPPASTHMKYPAIVYERSSIGNDFADDTVYRQRRVYQVTVIDLDPDSDIVRRVSMLPKCRFDRHFTSDKLNHDVFTLYF